MYALVLHLSNRNDENRLEILEAAQQPLDSISRLLNDEHGLPQTVRFFSRVHLPFLGDFVFHMIRLHIDPVGFTIGFVFKIKLTFLGSSDPSNFIFHNKNN